MACSTLRDIRGAVLVSFVATVLFTASLSGQITDVTNVTSTPIPGAGHDYIKALSETVNLSNGSVSLRIQVPTPPGRRLSLPFSFAYDTNGAHHMESNGKGAILWWDNTAALATGGWSYSLPTLSNVLVDIPGGIGPDCVYYNNYVFQDETGGRHSLYLALVPAPTSCPGKSSKLIGGDDYYQAVLSSNQSKPLPISDADGAVYTFPCCVLPYVGSGGTGNSTPQSGLPSSIEDRNGNIISVADHGNGTFAVTDTLGRDMLSSSGFGSSGTTVNASGLGGSYTLTWGTASSNYAVGSALVFNDGSCGGGIHNDVQTLNVITKLTLPNNTFYSFSYDPTYGVLSKITYPDGGYVSYTYVVSPLSEQAQFEDLDGKGTCIIHHDAIVAAHRYVSFDGISVAVQQDFSYSTTWNTQYPFGWTSKSTTVTTTDKITAQSYTTSYAYTGYGLPRQPNDNTQFGGQVAVENTVVYKDTTGATLRTITKSWHDQYELLSEQTALENSQTSKTVYAYGPGAQVTERDDYDYGNGMFGNLLRQIKTTYQSLGTPFGLSIFDRPCQIITYDGGTNRMAETDYTYDGGSAVCGTAGTPVVQDVSGLVPGTHDETHYSASSTASRGNVTQKIQWLKTGTSPVTTYTYDKTGQVLLTTDPCGNGTCSDMSGTSHTTTYSYADEFTVLSGGQNVTCTSGCPTSGITNAYLTTITDPLSHSASFTYDFNNGQLTKSTDANSQSATYIYNDSFARLTQANNPDGGQTQYAYNDSPYNSSTPSPSVMTTKAITPSMSQVSTVAFDGVGHTVKTILSSDPDGTTYTVTTYDGLGRPYLAYNPTRCNPPTGTCGETTWGISTYAYDALGRTTQVTEPDGSKVLNGYTGNCTAATDEAGNSRKSCVDGLGRLTGVLEDPAGLNYETDYAYSALSDLISVNQKGSNSANARIRSFQYDSLSRLTSAANPESGTITYAYDANGNVITKTAPSPNQPSTGTAAVATTYTYDSLNRLTGKSYSDSYTQNPATPAVTYGYDAANLSCPTPIGLGGTYSPNGLGRRTAMCFNSGSKSWAHDQMGRVSAENDRFIGLVPPYGSIVETGSNGIPTISTDNAYYYYLNGDLGNIFYPTNLPNYEFYTSENAAGRVVSVGDTLYNVLIDGKYTPDGQLSSALIGWNDGKQPYNGSPISNTYNNRLQQVVVSASTASNAPILNLTYNFNRGKGDNGNVIEITNGKDSTRNQNFTYDSLNRIQTAYTSGPNWGETYTTDAWANLTNIGQYPGKTNHEPLNCAPANPQNQLNTCFFYDAAGNLITNGSNTYTYDAENRLIAAAVPTGSYSYIYDGDGQRIEKCTQGTMPPGQCASNATGTFYWKTTDGSTQAESDLGGNWTAAYGSIRGRLAYRVDLPANVVHYYFQDHLGSTSIITDALGNIQNESDYYPYGGEIPITAGDSNRYKFTGKERDAESGLDNFGARYDASSMGRFMTPDPLPWVDWQHGNKEERQHFADFISNPQNFNMYAYVDNNPTSKTDPTGMEGCKAGDKTFSTCTIKIVYDPKTSKGTLTVLGENKGDKNPTVLLTSSVVVGGDGHVTPTGTFTATVWEKDHVSTKYGNSANTPWSKTVMGGNAFGPYQLHMKELDSRGIYIHGTMGPGWSPVTWGNSIFLSPTSHGCVRMCNRDDNALHDMMPNPSGNKVIISTEEPEE